MRIFTSSRQWAVCKASQGDSTEESIRRSQLHLEFPLEVWHFDAAKRNYSHDSDLRFTFGSACSSLSRCWCRVLPPGRATRRTASVCSGGRLTVLNCGTAACGSLRQLTSFAGIERPPSCRSPAHVVTGTVGGERPQTGTFSLNDGKRAASSSDPLSSLDPSATSMARNLTPWSCQSSWAHPPQGSSPRKAHVGRRQAKRPFWIGVRCRWAR
jgi:hypothetical protein